MIKNNTNTNNCNKSENPTLDQQPSPNNVEESLIDSFHNNAYKPTIFNNVINSDDEDDMDDQSSRIQQQLSVGMTSENMEILKTVNPLLKEYIQKNEYDRLCDITREERLKTEKRIHQRKPKCISNHSSIRLFQACLYEYQYQQVMQLVEEGSILNLTGFSSMPSMISIHPIFNYSINHYFNYIIYEEYISTLILPPFIYDVYNKEIATTKYAMLTYASFIISKDKFITLTNGTDVTFKTLLFNILEASHINKDQPLRDIRLTNQIIDFDPVTTDEVIKSFINKIITASINAIYLMALGSAMKEKIILKRVGANTDDLYICNTTKKMLLKLETKSTIFYAAKHKGWIFRKQDDTFYHDSIMMMVNQVTTLQQQQQQSPAIMINQQ